MKSLRSTKQAANVALAITIGAGAFFAASNVFAAPGPGLYIGAEYGLGRINDADFEDENNVLKGLVGGKFNKYIGIEIAASDFGEAKGNGYSSKLRGASAALVGFLPLTDSFELFIKGGNLWWENEIKVLGMEDTLDGDEFFYGAGANFNINKTVTVRAEVERYEVELSSDEVGVDIENSSTVDVASVGVIFNF